MSDLIVLYTETEGGEWKRHRGEYLGPENEGIAAVAHVWGQRLIVEDWVLQRQGLNPLRYAPLPVPIPE